jgi:hypothetical protein
LGIIIIAGFSLITGASGKDANTLIFRFALFFFFYSIWWKEKFKKIIKNGGQVSARSKEFFNNMQAVAFVLVMSSFVARVISLAPPGAHVRWLVWQTIVSSLIYGIAFEWTKSYSCRKGEVTLALVAAAVIYLFIFTQICR